MNEELVKRLEKKRMNMFIYSVIMLVIFVAVFMGIHMYLGNFLEDNITNYPFGDELIG
jgi:predicted PurR-regulated permease PerM